MARSSWDQSPRSVPYPFGELLLSLSRRRNFWRGWLGRPYAYVLGPEGNTFVFANDAKFRWREAFEALAYVDGETSVIVSDGRTMPGDAVPCARF